MGQTPASFQRKEYTPVCHEFQPSAAIVLGGDGSWDYVVPDPPHHCVFTARQNRVMVVEDDTGKLLREVTGIQRAHGTAIAESTGHGFATSGKTSRS